MLVRCQLNQEARSIQCNVIKFISSGTASYWRRRGVIQLADPGLRRALVAKGVPQRCYPLADLRLTKVLVCAPGSQTNGEYDHGGRSQPEIRNKRGATPPSGPANFADLSNLVR